MCFIFFIRKNLFEICDFILINILMSLRLSCNSVYHKYNKHQYVLSIINIIFFLYNNNNF
jgi:hypothetical protein